MPSCLAAPLAIHRRRWSLGPEAGYARVCRPPQPLFMQLILLHRLRPLALKPVMARRNVVGQGRRFDFQMILNPACLFMGPALESAILAVVPENPIAHL